MTEPIVHGQQVGDALRDSEAFRYRTFEASRIPIVVMDATTWRYVDCNPAATEIYGFSSREETLGKTPLDVSVPTQYDGTPSAEKTRHYIAEALAQGHVEFEWLHRRPDGALWDGEVHLMSFRSGERQFLQFTLRDITRQKRIEEELKDSRANLAALISSTNDLIWSVDSEYRLVTYNDALAEHLRRNRSIAIATGMSPRLQFPENLRQAWHGYYERARNQGAYRTEYPLPDGRTLELYFNPIRRDGQFVGVSVFGKDITERKRAEQALRESNSRLQLLLGSITDGFVATDLEGRLVEFNQAYVEMLGYTEEELRGLTFWDITPEKWHASEKRMLREELLVKGRAGVYEKEYRRKDGGVFPVELHTDVLRSLAGEIIGLCAIVRDITERKRTEAELRRHREHLEELVAARTAELQAANRELEAFSYSVSHDLRAPLRAIDGFAQILLQDFAPSLPQAGQRMLHGIARQAGLMGQLINDLLTFSHMGRQTMQSERIDMQELAQEAFAEQRAADLKAECKAQIQFHRLPPAFGDRAMIRVVVNNLLSNAIKYSRNRNPPLIEMGAFAQSAQNVYFIKDNGAGFDMKQAAKLFGVFQRLHSKEEFEGTGVGLALVQRIIQRHGGRVWAESKVDEGATFFFSLPAPKASS